MPSHESVLSQEVLAWLDPSPGEVIVDGTVGYGGHARLLLEKLRPGGRLIGFDKDPAAVAAASAALSSYGESVMILRDDFKNCFERMRGLGVKQVDGLLLDLGLSSPQIEEGSRGFSFQKEGPLDMRMDPSSALTAQRIVNDYSAKEIEDIFYRHGEARFARRFAGAIVRRRERKEVRTTLELEEVLFHAVPRALRHAKIHPATRAFQALRIAVNGELDSLESILKDAPRFMSAGARAVVISFHSGEDRIVKQEFHRLEKENTGVRLTRKPVRPGAEEVARNPRSRSACLRAFEMTAKNSAREKKS